MGNYQKQLFTICETKDLLQRGLKVLDLINKEERRNANEILDDFIILSSSLRAIREYSTKNMEMWNQYRTDKKINAIFEKSKIKEMFIRDLIEYLTNNETSIEMKVCIMYGIQIDNRLPFVALEYSSEKKGIIRDNQYQSTLKKLERNGILNKLEYIMKIRWDYLTERTDRVLALLNGLSAEEQEVLLAIAFIKYERFIHSNETF